MLQASLSEGARRVALRLLESRPRAIQDLKRRLREEEAQVPMLEARGYIRMREKSQQLIASLKPLIEALEGMSHDTPS